MRIIDRLYHYMQYKQLTAYAVERSCRLSNGYLGKQYKGKGTLGSDIIEKIHQQYLELNLIWLITGKGEMLGSTFKNFGNGGLSLVQEDDLLYENVKQNHIALLQGQIVLMEKTIADKDRIIALLEAALENKNNSSPVSEPVQQ